MLPYGHLFCLGFQNRKEDEGKELLLMLAQCLSEALETAEPNRHANRLIRDIRFDNSWHLFSALTTVVMRPYHTTLQPPSLDIVLRQFGQQLVTALVSRSFLCRSHSMVRVEMRPVSQRK
jgi:hypothetical protein